MPVTNFIGIDVLEEDAKVLKNLAQLPKVEYFKLKLLDKISEFSEAGFFIENNRVTGLTLQGPLNSPLPEEIGDLSELHTLNLIACSLVDFPLSMDLLQKLKILVLDRNPLEYFPEFIYELPQLEYLSIGLTGLLIPEDIGDLRSLKHFAWGYNGNEYFPESLWDLRLLETINLHKNYFTEIPEEITNLTALQELFIGHNPIDRLPKAMLQLPNLNKFNIQYTPIAKKPDKETKQILKELKKKKVMIIK